MKQRTVVPPGSCFLYVYEKTNESVQTVQVFRGQVPLIDSEVFREGKIANDHGQLIRIQSCGVS